MSILHASRPSVHTTLGSARPARSPRPFGLGVLPAKAYEPTARELAYEAAVAAVAGGRARWLSGRPPGVEGEAAFAAGLAAARRLPPVAGGAPDYDAMAEESMALDFHERGLDPAAARRSVLSRDVATFLGRDRQGHDA